MKPLSSELPECRFGSKPTDGGNLIVETDDYSDVEADPIAARYLRPFRMGRELVRGLDRWCLWMAEESFDPADIVRSTELKHRVEACQAMRLASKKKPTRESAATPYLFQENHQPHAPYVGIPAVVSSQRPYYTAAHLPAETIAGNKIYVAEDPQGFLFAIISSSMFITWQRAIGGRLKSDFNFSNTLVWNNLPLPKVTSELRTAIIKAGQGVLETRDLHPSRSLADAYNPLAMDPALVKAHNALDRVVDKAFGASRICADNDERQAILFERYVELTASAE